MKLTYGSTTTRNGLTVASSEAEGTPTTIAQPTPWRIRQRLAQRCSQR